MKKVIGISLLAVALIGCEKPATSSAQLGSFNVEKLFTVDGCNVYRFRDAGAGRYLTTCEGSVSSVEHEGEHSIQTTVR